MRDTKGFIDYRWPCPKCGSPSYDLVKWTHIKYWKRIHVLPSPPGGCSVRTYQQGHFTCDGCWKYGDLLQITV